MNEFIEKLIGRLEEGREKSFSEYTEAFELYREEFWRGRMGGFTNAIEIVNQLAEEYKTSFMEQLLEAKRNCGEDSDCLECPFGQIEDRCILNELQIESDNNGWIPCSEKMPCYYDNVLVCTKNGGRTIAHIKHTPIEWVDMYANKIDGVIAWMPLPEPFKPIAE